MGTCHNPIRNKLSTETLNVNMANTQDPSKGGCHPYDNHHHNYCHLYLHPTSEYHGRDGVGVGGVGG